MNIRIVRFREITDSDFVECSDEHPDSMKNQRAESAFLAFHNANPHVLDVLIEMAWEWKNSGRDKCSIAMLYERARWELNLRVKTDDEVILNNNHSPYYARLIMREPGLEGLFNCRRALADWQLKAA